MKTKLLLNIAIAGIFLTLYSLSMEAKNAVGCWFIFTAVLIYYFSKRMKEDVKKALEGAALELRKPHWSIRVLQIFAYGSMVIVFGYLFLVQFLH